MSFLYPNMLFGLIALAIPLAVHLFNFRRHKIVYFSNTATLKTIEQENAKTKKLKYVIIMIMRMLFIAGLVFAFAHPYRKSQNLMTDDAGNLIAVYIDNSMSMQSQSSEISLLEDARSSARALVRNISPSQRFVLLTNSREIGNEYPMSLDEMLMSIDGMKTEAGPLAFNELYENIQMIMRRNGFKSSSLFLYSDFQENMMNLDGIVVDSAIQIVAFPLVSDFRQNVYIDTVWLSSPILQVGLSNEVNVKIVNESEREFKGFPVNLEIDNHAVAFTTVDIQAGGKAEAKMQFVLDGTGQRTAKVSINDFPITFDDSYDFILVARPVIKIVELTDGQTVETHRNASEILFSNDSLFEYRSIAANRIDQQYLDDCQMVIVNDRSSLNETLWQAILDFAEDGGSVVVFPQKDEIADTNILNVNLLASQHEFFDDVFANIPDNADYPKVFKHTQIKKEFSNSLTLIGLQNGDPLVTLNRIGSGNVFVFSARLDSQWTDLAENALFVPLMMKMAMLGGSVGSLSYTIGVDNDLKISDMNAAFDGEIRIRDEKNSMEMIPAVERRGNKSVIRLNEQLPNAGFYDVCKDDEIIEKTAWNDSRVESKMSFCNQNYIDKLLKNNGLNVLSVMDSDDLHSDEIIDVLVRKSMLWKSFILLSLIAMLIEILIIRFWK
ncbi:MAG: BatA domain-containing protein [Bacteroidales bacterium]|nr:BatA domain-containing protein [Bacteroidales bacterium]